MNTAPGRSKRRFPRLLWIVPGLALGATTAWWIARAPQPSDEKAERKQAAAAAAARIAAVADVLARLRQEPDPMAYFQARAHREDSEAIAELIQAYAAWGSRTDATEARKLIVKKLLENPNMKIGLPALLKAVTLDTTPRRQDPMWSDLVKGVAGLWDTVTVPWGRDLVQLEANPKAKDLLLESLANAAREKISPEQQHLLTADLIDLYPYASPDQKPALDKALAAMAGSDVVEILARRGINEGSSPLASIQKVNQDLEASKRQYKKVLEDIENEERAATAANAREAGKARH